MKSKFIKDNINFNNLPENMIHDIAYNMISNLTLIKNPIESILNGEYGREIKNNHDLFKIIDQNCNKLLISLNQLLDNDLFPIEDKTVKTVTPPKKVTKDRENSPDKEYTLLLIEDDNDLTDYMQSVLEKQYNLIVFNNGLKALNKINQYEKIDLIICDIMMPLLDGLSLRKRILKIDGVNNIPFIFLTAKSSAEDEMEGLELGIYDYIKKPFSIESLKLKIRNILKFNKQQTDSIRKNIKDQLDHLLSDTHIKKNVHLDYEEKLKEYHLTPREMELINFTLKGNLDKEIAALLNISVKTVSNHIYHIYEKLNVSNRVELLNFILKK